MEDSSSISAKLETLRRRRGHRRGQVTKLRKKILDVQNTPPDDIDLLVVDDLLLDLQTQTADHDALQAQIDVIYVEHPDLSVDEEDERDRLQDAYRSLKNILVSTQKAGPLWADSKVILQQLEHAAASPRPDSPHYRATVDGLVSSYKALSISSASILRYVPHLRDRIAVLEEKSSYLLQLINDDFKDPVTSTPTPVPSDPSHPTGHNSSLHIDVPTFDGDPIKWENFETMFRAAIKSRAKGHSNLEIKGHLLKAVKHPEGQTLLNNLPCRETDLDSMLATLKDRFGSAEVICPMLIQKINRVTQFGLSAHDIDFVHKNFALSFQKLHSLVGDSLSSYLALVLVGMMSLECKREWLRHKKPDAVPDMWTLIEFLKYWKKELAPEPTAHSIQPATVPSSAIPPKPPNSSP